MKMVAVLVPIYKNELSRSELISLQQCKMILHQHPIILIAPEKMNIKNKELTGLYVERFQDYLFDGVEGYNQLMMSQEFYHRFEFYEYILIYQLDAFVFSDMLQYFCSLNYDYIGAPWLRGHRYIKDLERKYFYVGNGGFSLRKISAFLNILNKEAVKDISEPEDIFWVNHQELKVAPVEVAVSFSIEEQVKKSFELNRDRLPFGCHAWFKFDFNFFRPYIQKYGYELKDVVSNTLDEELSKNERKKDCFDADKIEIFELLNVPYNKRENFKVVIFGAGKLGDECYKVMSYAGINIEYCIDNDKKKQGKYLWKHKIISFEQLASMKEIEDMIIIVAIGHKYCNDVLKQIDSLLYITKIRTILYKDLKTEIVQKLNMK